MPIGRLLTIKGAPDILINYCTRYVSSDGERHKLDDAMRAQVESIKSQWCSQGKRVILLARRIVHEFEIESSTSDSRFEDEITRLVKKELTLVGLVGIVDPLREEIPEVTRTLRRAGIRIFMVTGDFALTAQAIAAECGVISNTPDRVDGVDALLSTDKRVNNLNQRASNNEHRGLKEAHSSIVISGSELIGLNDSQWNQLCEYNEVVFARTRQIKSFASSVNSKAAMRLLA